MGAGPVGLALALLLSARCPGWRVSVFDRQALSEAMPDTLAGSRIDARTLALSLGSVQLLERLGAWPARVAQPILQVHVSQTPPGRVHALGEAAVRLRADELGVPLLGAVLGYDSLRGALCQAALDLAARPGDGLQMRFGCEVEAVRSEPHQAVLTLADGREECVDLAVVAEGGVFSEQASHGLRRDYGQLAWVGSVELAGAAPGLAVERFTRDGPLALLPLPPLPELAPGISRAALVCCVPARDDPLAPLSDPQRLAWLNARLPEVAGRVAGIGPLKPFQLGLNARSHLSEPCVVRIGNAAQTLHPVAGQGLNLGLRDAHALADACARLGRSPAPADWTRALRRLAFARAPDRWSVIALTDLFARGFAWRAPGLAALRGVALAAVQTVPPLKSALARQMMFGWR